MSRRPAQEALEMLRNQRHSFLNQLQVIAGWLQMGRPERAHQFVGQLTARFAAEGAVLRQVSEPLGLMVIAINLEAESFGVQVEWQVAGEPDPPDEEAASRRRAEVAAALKAASRLPEPSRRIAILLGPGDSFQVHTPGSAGAG